MMAYNQDVEIFRNKEYPMLQGKTYLDHGGSTMYAKSLIESFSREMISNLYGNPHSASAPAELSGNMIDDVREKTLRFFGADPAQFDLVFVANATAGIKLTMDCFRDLSTDILGGFRYLYHKDSHTSLVGIREVTENHHCFQSDREVEEWLDCSLLNSKTSTDDAEQLSLFAYPGQSNMTGRRLPLTWPRRLRQSSLRSHQNVYTLLDVAALATTSSLERVFSDPGAAPDFTVLSFYKIFGFPDLGALIVRRKSGHILSWRKYFGGGTVNMITVFEQALHFSREGDIHNKLEDGTLGFHNILALGCGIDVHRRLYVDMNRVSRHVAYLGYRLHSGLVSLRHSNGKGLCEIYNEPGNKYSDSEVQGGTVAFNIKQSDGSYVSFTQVEAEANAQHIYLRAGGLCNPGGIATYLSLPLWQMKRAWAAGHRCTESEYELIYGKPLGVVRASLGAMSIISDVDTLLEWLASTYLEKSTATTITTSSITISNQIHQSILYKVNQVPQLPYSSASDPPLLEHNQSKLNLAWMRHGSKAMPKEEQSPYVTKLEPVPSGKSFVKRHVTKISDAQLQLGFDWTNTSFLSDSQSTTLPGISPEHNEMEEQTKPSLSTAKHRADGDAGENHPVFYEKPCISTAQGGWDRGLQSREHVKFPTEPSSRSEPWIWRQRRNLGTTIGTSVTEEKEKKGFRNLWRVRR